LKIGVFTTGFSYAFGLAQKWSEKLKNLNEESNRFWNHIETGYLDFCRREKDVAILQTVTKDEVLSLFSTHIDPASPARSKLSVHLRPQKTVPHKFTLAAAKAFLVQLRAHNIPVDEEKYLALSASEPPIAAVKAHWTNALIHGKDSNAGLDPAQARALVEEIDTLGSKYPAEGENAVELSKDVVFISDIGKFKDGLRLSGPARPVEEFHDLPLSRF